MSDQIRIDHAARLRQLAALVRDGKYTVPEAIAAGLDPQQKAFDTPTGPWEYVLAVLGEIQRLNREISE